MPQPNLQASGWRRAFAAAGWAAGCAVAAGGAWALGLIGSRLLFGGTLPTTPARDVVAAVVLTQVWGILVGIAAGLVLGGRGNWASAVSGWVVGLTLTAAAASSVQLFLSFVAHNSLSPVANSTLAWAIAGALAGLGGYAWRRAGDVERQAVVAATGWGLGTAAVMSGGWVVGAVVPGHFLDVRLDAPSQDEAAYLTGAMAVIGLAVGFVVGVFVGGVISRSVRAVLRWALGGAVAGALGGAMVVPVLLVTAGVFSAWAGSCLAFAAAGFVVGLGGYAVRRPPTGNALPDGGWVLRLLPVLGVTGACLAVVGFGSPRFTVIPLLAVALLGLAVAWALAGQELRIRDLERQLRARDTAPPRGV